MILRKDWGGGGCSVEGYTKMTYALKIHSSSVTLHLASTVGITHQTAEAVVPEEGRIIV